MPVPLRCLFHQHALLPTPYSLLPTPYSRLPTPYSLLPTPYSRLPTPYSPSIERQLPEGIKLAQ
ncbi:hypothetical protein [Moorena sp. SIO3I8]|uniref:hypothetical protein n=1 Tax=Moorena sp. SIO3I8 TaxID=2607833 RepID=UPI0013C044FE|nr:hypothetical protein [Moorena sp. SIO3I8]NEO08716.1 hypothetical protein [Moorena sp. SIO3I8]